MTKTTIDTPMPTVPPEDFIVEYTMTSLYVRNMTLNVLSKLHMDIHGSAAFGVWDKTTNAMITISNPSTWVFERVGLLRMPPDPEGMNDDRASWANTALSAFGIETGMINAGEDDQTIMGDLVADLMHFADRNNIDFEKVLRGARMHYEEETSDRDTTLSEVCNG
jgi:hypothetical protein